MVDYDFYIYTDGSGCPTVGPGAYAANIVSVKFPTISCTSVVGGSSRMEIGRAELTAVLDGLQRVVDYLNKKSIQRRLSVLIVSDREDVVGVINKLFKAKKNLDLWARYEWYLSRFDIQAKWVKRETNVIHSLSDRLASGFRLVISDYIKCQTSVEHITKT